MKNFPLFGAALLLFCFAFSFGCGQRQEPDPTPVPEEGFIRQSYDIQGLVYEDNEARVFGLVLNTGTLDIAYIGFTVQLCDSRGNALYEKFVGITLYEALVPGDVYPFNCIFERLFEEDAAVITSVCIDGYTWQPSIRGFPLMP